MGHDALIQCYWLRSQLTAITLVELQADHNAVFCVMSSPYSAGFELPSDRHTVPFGQHPERIARDYAVLVQQVHVNAHKFLAVIFRAYIGVVDN